MGLSPNTQSLLSQLPKTVKILDHLVVSRQPLIFFLLLPLAISPNRLPCVTRCLQSLLYSNSTIWLLLHKQYQLRSRTSSTDGSQEFDKETIQAATLIEDEMLNLISSWKEQQPKMSKSDYMMKDEISNECTIESEFIQNESIRLYHGEKYGFEEPIQVHMHYMKQEEKSDLLSEIPIPISSSQLLRKLRSDILLHIYYHLFIKMNILVCSNSVCKLAAIYDILMRMIKIAGIEYYGIPYYTESLAVHHDFLYSTAEYSAETNASFIACIHHSYRSLKK